MAGREQYKAQDRTLCIQCKMTKSGRTALVALSLLLVFASLVEGDDNPYPPVPGLDPDGDAAHRAAARPGQTSMWQPVYLQRLRSLRKKWKTIAPIHFHQRACGEKAGARQIIVRLSAFDLDAILKDDASQTLFLMYLRWLFEAYWRRIVPKYRLEPKPISIVDFEGLSWRTLLTNSLSINSLIRKLNSAFHGVTGKGMGTLFILNAPAGFSSLWTAVTTLVTFRKGEVVMIKNESHLQQLQKAAGEMCLWEGLGGKSKLPLGTGAVEDAFTTFSDASDEEVENEDLVRLSPEDEDFLVVEASEGEPVQVDGAASVTAVTEDEKSQAGVESEDSSLDRGV